MVNLKQVYNAVSSAINISSKFLIFYKLIFKSKLTNFIYY